MPPSNSQIGSGMTEQDLKAASWWVKNAALVKKVRNYTLIGLGVIFWGYSLWSLLDAYAISYPRESRITATILRNHLTQQALDSSAPQALSASAIRSFSTTANRRDFAVQLSNANPQWWAEFKYDFGLTGVTTTPRTGFILPNSQTYLTELGTTGSGSPNLNLTDIRWHRLTPNEVGSDYGAFRDKRLQLKIENVAYKRDLALDNNKIGQTTFTLNNQSAYGFWSVDLTVLLYQSGSPVAINKITLEQLRPGEMRAVSLNWFENLDNVDRTEVVPAVNILDPGAFLPAQFK